MRDSDEWVAFISGEQNSPEAVEPITGVPAEELRAAARLYAQAPNGAIYYGLGVTEHSQGSTTVMGMANLAMACGNIGRDGVGVNPLRGQNNVQGACDMGSFPHELSGYRHVSDDAVRHVFENLWGTTLLAEPGLRIPNMFDAAIEGTFRGLFVHGEDIAQSDPNVKHVLAALGAMELLVVQDLFPNETAKYAHVFLPGASFLEKDGTFTQRRTPDQPGPCGDEAEERPARVGRRQQNRHGHGLSHALRSPGPDHGRDRLCHTDFCGRFVRKAGQGRQHPVAMRRARAGGYADHARRVIHPGPGRFVPTPFVPTDERSTRRYPLILTTGRILSQYNVGAQTRRTANIAWHQEDLLEIHPDDAEVRGIADGDEVTLGSRVGETKLRAQISDRMSAGVVYTTFHYPVTGANVVTTENSDWATNCPEYKVTAVQVTLTHPVSHLHGEPAADRVLTARLVD